MSVTKSTQRRPARSKGGKVLVGHLARLLTDAALFASRDTTLPMINVIRLDSTGDRLIAAATDRFTLGVSTVNYLDPGTGHPFEVSLKLQQAQILARIAKSGSADLDYATVTSTAAGTSFDFTTGERLILPDSTEHPFPEWRKIVDTAQSESSGVQVMSFDPALMARFAKVSGARKMGMKFTEPTKPALITIGDSFIGLIMPQRIESGRELVWSPDWLKNREQSAVSAPAKRAAKKAS